MIQESFCSKLNSLSYDIYVVFLCLLSFFFFRWTSKILLEMKNSSKKKEFPTPLAGIADQVLQKLKSIFFCFLLLSSYNFCKKKLTIAIL